MTKKTKLLCRRMQFSPVLLCLTLFLTSLCAFGQKSAYIFEEHSGKRIENATVFYSDSQGVFSDGSGEFSVPYNIDSIFLHKLGYKDTTISGFRAGDTLTMRKEYAFLREVQIQADAVDPRDLLKAILIKSAEHYVKGAPFFQPYTYSESFYINSSKQFSLFVPKAYFNAFDDKKPFVKCYFYPVDSLIVNTSEIVNMKLVRGPLGFYSFRRFLPVPEIPDELTAKDNEYLIYGVNNEEARLEIDNIKKRGLENKAEIVYKGKDSLVTMYFTEVTSSSGFADMRMSAGVSMIYDGYTYKPPFSRYFKAIYLEEDESYLLREIQYVIEVAFVRKESDEVKVMTNEISIKVLQEKALLEEKLKDSGAKRLMGAIDGFTKHEYYNNYIRKTSVKER